MVGGGRKGGGWKMGDGEGDEDVVGKDNFIV